MSSRQMRKLEEKQMALQQQTLQEEKSDNEEEPVKQNLFDMLVGDNQESDDENQDQQTEQSKIPEKQENEIQQQPQLSKKKKNKRKQKKEANKAFEKVLEEFKTENNSKVIYLEEQKQFEFTRELGNFQINSSLQLFLSKLNYNKELQKYFKNVKLVENDKEEEEQQIQQMGGRRMKGKRLQQSQGRKIDITKNLRLVYGLKGARPMPEKFRCQFLNMNEVGQKVFALYPTPGYEKKQESYLSVKNTMDPQMMFDFIQQTPYHIDGLFDIMEFFRLQGNFKQANGLLEQILFLYEDSLSVEFKQIFEDTSNRICLSYNETIYSNTFFRSLLQFIDILGKKGCYRAALEYSKFLLKLNPLEDPVGALLCLDYNSLSCKQFDYLTYFVETFAKELYRSQKFSIIYLPNMIYSCSVAKFTAKKDIPNQEQLVTDISDLIQFKEEDIIKAMDFDRNHIQDSHNVLILVAILLYPRLIKELGEKNEFQKVANVSHSLLVNWQKKTFKEIFEHEFFKDIEQKRFNPYGFLQLQNDEDLMGLEKILEIYVERSKIIYKNTQLTLWLKSAIGFLLNYLESKGLAYYEEFLEKLCLNEAKNNLIPFQLRRYKDLHKSNFSDHVERLDLDNIEDNQNQMGFMQQVNQHQNPVNTNSNIISQFFSSMLPWVNLPNQGQNQQQNLQDFDPNDVFIEDEDGDLFEDDFQD